MTTAVSEAGRTVRPAIEAVTTQESLDEVVSAYGGVDAFVIDVETWGEHRVDPRRNEILWVGLATQGRADIIPLGHPNGELVEIKRGLVSSGVLRLHEGKDLRKSDVSKAKSRERKVFSTPPSQLNPAEVFRALEPLLFSDSRKIGANIKFDLESVAKYYGGRIPPGDYGDVIVADFLLDDRYPHQMGLAHICKRRLGYDMPKGVGAEVENFSFQEVAQYLHGDVKFTWLLWNLLYPQVVDNGLSGVLALEMDLTEVLMHMEMAGIRVDEQGLKELQAELDQGLNQAKADAYRAAGRVFNINSVAEKRELLFTDRGLTPKKFTAKTGEPSVSADALKMFPKDPLAKSLLEVAEIAKLQSTYVVPYLGGEASKGGKKVSKESLLVNGKVHTGFKQHGARAGRLSSSRPNLQNIPARGRYGKRIRGMFTSDPGYVLIDADYAQIEPRMMASLSEDPKLLHAFRTGEDVYTTIADPLGVDRTAGKVLLLSLAYGVGARKVAEDLSIGVRDAYTLLEDFERKFPVLARYKTLVIRQASRRRPTPYVQTILGRRRMLPEILSKDEGLRAYGQRVAFNARIQGSSAEIMKLALIRAHRMVPETARVLLTVHDEIVVMSPEKDAQETKKALRQAMEGVDLAHIKVPLAVDIGIGTTWAEAKGD